MVSLCRFHHSHVLTSHCHRKFAQLDPQKSSDIQAWVGPPRDPRGGTSASDQQRAMAQMGLFRQYKRSPLQCRGKSVNAAFPLFGPCFLWPWICRLECCIVPFLCKSDIGGIFMLVVSSGFFFFPKQNKRLNAVLSNSTNPRASALRAMEHNSLSSCDFPS